MAGNMSSQSPGVSKPSKPSPWKPAGPATMSVLLSNCTQLILWQRGSNAAGSIAWLVEHLCVDCLMGGTTAAKVPHVCKCTESAQMVQTAVLVKCRHRLLLGLEMSKGSKVQPKANAIVVIPETDTVFLSLSGGKTWRGKGGCLGGGGVGGGGPCLWLTQAYPKHIAQQ